jgi:hypothetical protein
MPAPLSALVDFLNRQTALPKSAVKATDLALLVI